MRTSFPFISSNNFPDIALIEESGNQITYKDLALEIERWESKLGRIRCLILFKITCDLRAISLYLFCLKHNHVMLLIDANMDDSKCLNIANSYCVNYIYDGVLKEVSSQRHILADNLALLLSTSGSTGSSKFVALSYDNILSNAESISLVLKIDKNSRTITNLPLHYSFGLSILNSYLISGASVQLTVSSPLTSQFWELMSRSNITSISGVPFHFEIFKRLRIASKTLPKLKVVTQAGGRLPEEMCDYLCEWAERNDLSFFKMYGQTEATARISCLSSDKVFEKKNSVGQAIPNGRLVVRDSNNALIQDPFIIGEICYKGPNVMLGYSTEVTDLAYFPHIEELNTGDLGYFDDEGYFYITGRSNRFCKVSHQRVDLDGIEELLNQNEFDVKVGESAGRLIIAIKSQVSQQDILKLLRSEVNVFHTHVRFIQLQEWPRTSSGKIDYQCIERAYDE